MIIQTVSDIIFFYLPVNIFHVSASIYIHLPISVYIGIYLYVSVSASIYINICLHQHIMYLYLHISISVSISVCIYPQYIYIDIYFFLTRTELSNQDIEKNIFYLDLEVPGANLGHIYLCTYTQRYKYL